MARCGVVLRGEPPGVAVVRWLRPFGGVNLAIAYGMGLIAGAFVLAIVYMAACRAVEGGGPPRG